MKSIVSENMRSISLFSTLIAFSLFFCQCSSNSPKNVHAANSSNTSPYYDNTFPLETARLTTERPEQLLRRTAYTVSYNKDTRCPNWVGWHLTKAHTNGPYTRKGVPYYNDEGEAIGIGAVTAKTLRSGYFVDPQVPTPRQEHSDWKVRPANMDHGHMCPAADCKWSKEAINQSFYLTNMCPQDHELNRDDWDMLEKRCRSWANKYGDIYIIAGPIFYNDTMRTFGNNQIAIPDAFFKVVLCMKGKPKALGFIFPNDNTHAALHTYATTVDEVERQTGLDFFYNLPDSIEDQVERLADYSQW